MKDKLNNLMSDEYVQETALLDYHHPAIQELIQRRGWKTLDTYHKIEQIYQFVQNEILFGYNRGDDMCASEILADGIGQCNTKAILLMALLRGVDLPTRFHAFSLENEVQKGAIPPLLFPLAPKEVIHTWAEVWYEEQWCILEGVILDKDYLHKVQKMAYASSSSTSDVPVSYKGYAIGIEDVFHPPIDWKGLDTFIQHTGIRSDYGIYSAPDDFFLDHSQNLKPWKRWIYEHFTCHTMTKRINKLRLS